jgi:hypothetical protein
MTNREKLFLDTMKRCRGIEFARIGMRVDVAGEPGTICGANDSANLDVIFNRDKYKWIKYNCHPFYETVYYDADGKIIADYRAKKG